MPPLWQPPNLSNLISEYLAGASIHQLSRTHKVDRTTITKCLRRAGIVTRDHHTALRIIPSIKLPFDAYVKVIGECEIWTGTKSGKGYGKYYVGTIDGEAQYMLAHRYSWQRANGRSLSPGELVCHSCDTPPCTRPKHLFVGSYTDNMRDAANKGRMNGPGNGEQHPNHKLTDKIIITIRQLAKSGVSQKDLANQFCINQSTVNRIINKKRWSHL